MASYLDREIDRQTKICIGFIDSSSLRQNNDKEKYDKANKLEKHITKVQREIINRMLNISRYPTEEVATVSYLIFKLAMRVGDEKIRKNLIL